MVMNRVLCVFLLFAAMLQCIDAAPSSSCSSAEPQKTHQRSAMLQFAQRDNFRDDQASNLHPKGPSIALLSADGGTDFGSPKCPCIGIDNITGTTIVNLDEGVNASYPADVGAHCEGWDKNLHPACKSEDGAGPSFCKQRWCFVDPCKCDIPVMPKLSLYLESARFQGKPIYFSYATCGAVDEWTAENKDDACVNQAIEEDCKILADKCTWSADDGKCGGKEAMGACAALDVDPKIVGSDGCRCVGISNQSGTTDLVLGGEKIPYPADVGSACRKWDLLSHPDCQLDDKEGKVPDWCKQKWCYVDPCSCGLVSTTPPKVSLGLKDATIQGKPVYYSYATCGDKDMWTAENNEAACVNQKSEEECSAKTKCAWSADNGCLGKELVEACPPTLDGEKATSSGDMSEESDTKAGEEQSEQISDDVTVGAKNGKEEVKVTSTSTSTKSGSTVTVARPYLAFVAACPVFAAWV